MSKFRPYLYPFVSTTAPVVPQDFTIVSVTRQIPKRSKFIWTHSVQSIDSDALTAFVEIQLIDSITGPITSIPVSIGLIGGPPGRPFPLPEPFVFAGGSIITATIKILTNDPPPAFGGLVLCGMREII